MTIYRVTRPDGTVEYTDSPSGPGHVDKVGERDRSFPENDGADDHREIKKVIKEVQKRVPKINDYLEYLEYLRNHRPFELDRILRQLQREDPQTWLKLQKFPQFKPLRESTLGIKAAEKHLGPVAALVASGASGGGLGKMTGSLEAWLETTVKGMMKRDRYGPFADVLGSKASTLPAPKSPTYSKSRLGQHLKVEDARSIEAAKQSAKAVEASRAAVRGARAAAITRSLNPLLDLGIGALNPDFFKGISYIRGVQIAKRLEEKGILDAEEAYMLPRMMLAGDFDKAIAMINAGLDRAGISR